MEPSLSQRESSAPTDQAEGTPRRGAEEAPAPAPQHPLVRGDFRRLLIGQYLAQAGDGLMQATYATVLILAPEGAPARILAVLSLTLLPYSLVAPLFGVLVDRWPRRALMARATVARALILLPLALVWRRSEALLYVSLLTLTGLGRLFLTTKSAALPTVLHESHLLRGNSISGGGGIISALVGAVAGAGIVELAGVTAGLVAAAALLLLAAIPIRTISSPLDTEHAGAPVGEAIRRVIGDLHEGFTIVWKRLEARVPLAAMFALRAVGVFVAIIAILVIKKEFPGTSGRLSASALALGAAGAGSLIGATIAPATGRRIGGGGLVIAGYVISGAGVVALGGVGHLGVLLGLMVIGGLGGFITKVAVDAQLQEALPEGYRGRGFAVYDILYNCASVVAALAILFTQSIPLRPLMLAVGGLTLMAGALVAAALRRAGLWPRSIPP